MVVQISAEQGWHEYDNKYDKLGGENFMKAKIYTENYRQLIWEQERWSFQETNTPVSCLVLNS